MEKMNVFIAVFLIILISLLFAMPNFVKNDERIINVSEKEVKKYNHKDKYLIYSNKGTFEITDSILNLRYDSSDLYGYLKKDNCYKISTDIYSFRIPFLSKYQNILTANKVSCSTN